MSHSFRKPRVSVIMAVYNTAQFLRESIESMLNQSLRGIELIIVDDASTDEGPSILREYAEADPRVILHFNQCHQGQVISRNRALELASADFIAVQDSDDVSLPGRLAAQVAVLESQPGVVLVAGDYMNIDAEGSEESINVVSNEQELMPWAILFNNALGGHSQMMYRRDWVRKLGGYSDTFRHAEDYCLWTQLAELGRFVVLPQVLMKYRRHRDQASSQYAEVQAERVERISEIAIDKVCAGGLRTEEIRELRKFWMQYPLWSTALESRELPRLHGWFRLLTRAFFARRPHVRRSHALANVSLALSRRFLAASLHHWREGRHLSAMVAFQYGVRWRLDHYGWIGRSCRER